MFSATNRYDIAEALSCQVSVSVHNLLVADAWSQLSAQAGRQGIPEEILEVSLAPRVKSHLKCSATFRCIMTFTIALSSPFLLTRLHMPLLKQFLLWYYRRKYAGKSTEGA